MDSKLGSALQKVLSLKGKGNFTKALSRLDDLIAKNKLEAQLLFEALDISLEACLSRQACMYFKKAFTSFPEQRDRLWAFSKDRLKANNDQVFAKYLIEQALKNKDLPSAIEIIKGLANDVIEDLLKRNRVKKRSIIAASHGKPELSGDILINIYSEALLSLGLGKNRESAQAFMQIIEQRSGEIDCIECFLEKSEGSSSGHTALSYALGCCYLAREKYDKAIDLMLLGAKSERSLLDDFVARINKIKEKLETPPEELDLALAEVHLIRQAVPQAAEALQEILESRPAQASAVLDLLAEHIESDDEDVLLGYLFIDAAIMAKQYSRAIERIKKLYDQAGNRKSIMEWLDKKYNECALSQHVLMCYADLALQENLIDRGIEILKSILTLSPSQQHDIARTLEKHKDKDDKLIEFYKEISPKEEAAPLSSDFEIEVFEKTEFKFSPSDDPSSMKESIETTNESSPQPLSRQLTGEEPPASPDESFLEKTPDKLFRDIAEGKDPEPRKSDYEEACREEAADGSLERKEEPDGRSSAKPSINLPCISPEEKEKTTDFKTRLEHLVRGKSDEDAELVLNEFSKLGEREKTDIIISLKAEGKAAQAMRKFFLAGYYLANNSPLEALAIMKSIPKNDIPSDFARRYVLQMASCYRRLHMFDAAQGTLLEACDHFMEDGELRRLSKLNYSDYLDQICRGALVLEKAGNLE